MSGGVVMVALSIFERLSGKSVPLWVYGFVLLFFAFLACYLAWRDSQKALASISETGQQKRQFLAERINTLLREAGEVDYGEMELSAGSGRGEMVRWANHRARVHHFLQAHFDSGTVKRFEGKGNRVLEELLEKVLTDEETPRLIAGSYPPLEIEITQTAFDFIDDISIAGQFGLRHKPCYVTLFLKIKNPRSIAVAVEIFKLTLIVNGEEHLSFAESKVFGRRFVSQEGLEAGEGSHPGNLGASLPLVVSDDKPVDGSLQFIFRDLRDFELTVRGISFKDSPFFLVLIDRNRERHTKEGVLSGEGLRYIEFRNTQKP
jgi:hypothetical protein